MEEKAQFHFGMAGPWITIIFLLAGMIASTILHKGMAGLLIVCFTALFIGFLLAKDKKNFGKITITGLQNSILGTITVAFLFAGILAQLMRQSGLIDALIYGITSIGFSAGFVPAAAFIICMIISTACGTSTGSVAAVAPVLVPVAHGLGIDLGLICGAIVSGAIFGDNLAPISDTTIASALTQEAKINDVVRTRLPYSLISAAVSLVLFIFIGQSMVAGTHPDIASKTIVMQSYVLLLLPFIMVFMMRKGWDIMATLLICDIAGVIINLCLGCISPAVMFSGKGPVVSGMMGMMVLLVYVILLFMILQIMKASGAFEQLGTSMMKWCKSYRSGELVVFANAAIGSIITGGSSPSIIFFGPFVRQITKELGIDRCRGANILDGTACGITGLMPHGNPNLVSIGVVMAIPGVDPSFSFLNILPYNYHCWGLLIIFLLSIMTGIGRRFEKPVLEEGQER